MNLDVFYKNNSAHFGRTALFEGDIERKGNETALRERKEVNFLEQSPSERKTIQHQFDRRSQKGEERACAMQPV